jgi:hypothetical protein
MRRSVQETDWLKNVNRQLSPLLHQYLPRF